MLLGTIWTAMTVVSVLFGIYSGSAAEVGNAALEGARAALTFALEIGGVICLWCAVMELMKQAGILSRLEKLLRPLLEKLFPDAAGDESIMQPLCMNVAANFLGLGNAATPTGIRAAQGMAARSKSGEATPGLCRLVVLNTASIQLLPTAVAAIRASFGAASPFDILPEVWISSLISVTVGLCAARLFETLSDEPS